NIVQTPFNRRNGSHRIAPNELRARPTTPDTSKTTPTETPHIERRRRGRTISGPKRFSPPSPLNLSSQTLLSLPTPFPLFSVPAECFNEHRFERCTTLLPTRRLLGTQRLSESRTPTLL